MHLGIVIVSWNVRELLSACLDSVFAEASRSGLRARVVVVDNASTDDSPAMVRDRFPGVDLIPNPHNPGFGAANNQGIKFLQTSNPKLQTSRLQSLISNPQSPITNPQLPACIVFLNPDTAVRPGALAALLDFLHDHPRAGAAGAKLLNPDGSLQHSAFRFPGVVQAGLDLFPPGGRFQRLLDSPINGRYPRALYEGGKPFRVDFPLGAAFAVRGEVVRATGGFDERYHMYCEEIDWHWRIARAGWERWCVPAAEVVHHGGQSTGQVRLESFRALWESRRRLYGQYRPPATVRIVGWLVRWGMAGRSRNASPDAQRVYAEVSRMWA